MAEQYADTVENAMREALAESYGIDAELVRLPGENVNFLVNERHGHRYVAKIAGDQQPPEFVDLERAALAHAMAAGIGLHLPLIEENRFGNTETLIATARKTPSRMRLIEFVEGTPWSEMPRISDELRFDLGWKLATFDRAMQGFEHPMAHRTHRWDLTRVDQHRGNIHLIDEPDKHRLLSWALSQWTNQASPALRTLEAQFIHGDPNPENILVSGRQVAGFIDFGDCCWNPPVCELAICLAYQMMDQDDPWAAAAPVIAGWSEVQPLTLTERQILPALVMGRLANTLCVAAERATRDPAHPNWFVSVAGAWRLLGRMQGSAEPSA